MRLMPLQTEAIVVVVVVVVVVAAVFKMSSNQTPHVLPEFCLVSILHGRRKKPKNPIRPFFWSPLARRLRWGNNSKANLKARKGKKVDVRC